MNSQPTPRPVHIIAEAGTNHNGDLAAAKRLVDLAVRAKADTVKFQMIDPDYLYLPGQYEFGRYDIDEVRLMRKRFMLTDAQYRELAEYAGSASVPFTASVFDEHALDLLASFGPPYIKIASTDLNNVRFLRKVAGKGIRIILSTGLSSLGDVENSVREILRTGFFDLVLMHCVSAYPAQLAEMNLPFIDTLRSAFGLPVGLSDHTQSSVAACLALTKGVSYIEKHFTFDRSADGFDHAYACEGEAFIDYIAEIRGAEAALSVPPAKLGDNELTVRKRARRSLYAARDMEEGEAIQNSDILVLRPENVMSADQVDVLVGKRLRCGVGQYQPFDLGMV